MAVRALRGFKIDQVFVIFVLFCLPYPLYHEHSPGLSIGELVPQPLLLLVVGAQLGQGVSLAARRVAAGDLWQISVGCASSRLNEIVTLVYK